MSRAAAPPAQVCRVTFSPRIDGGGESFQFVSCGLAAACPKADEHPGNLCRGAAFWRLWEARRPLSTYQSFKLGEQLRDEHALICLLNPTLLRLMQRPFFAVSS
jgi:hypothetical protein